MLNWIWLGLIVIAVAVATGRDISELSQDRFRNEKAISFTVLSSKQTSPDHYSSDVILLRSELKNFYDASDLSLLHSDTVHVTIDYSANKAASFSLPADTIAVWRDMALAQGDEKKINGTISSVGPGVIHFIPEPVKFRILAKVVNDGLLKTADTAVTIALGLIGVMALWLGIMKIAEAAGLITLLAKLAKPLMVRLFPEVPPEHPAMGAMLSNMAANFLGLSNAATPLGLKAMEELNKLNPNAGTATNAMCMFLTINTSAITLIPATVIAIRLSLGSKSPTDIIIPTFFATLIALICGVFFNKFIQRFFPVKAND
jgi:spore maturation protein SpmA